VKGKNVKKLVEGAKTQTEQDHLGNTNTRSGECQDTQNRQTKSEELITCNKIKSNVYKDTFTDNEFKSFYTNVNSLPNKLQELKLLLQSHKIKSKIVVVTEIKHKNNWNVLSSELQIDGYNLYTNDLRGNGRGVTIYVSNDFCCNHIYSDSVFKDFVIIELRYGLNEKLIFCHFFRSPNSSAESDEKLFSLINMICNRFICYKIFLRDFNFTHIDWTTSRISSSCTACNKLRTICRKFFNTACYVSN